MDLDKAWLYHQGNWTEVADPAAQFPEEIDHVFEKLHYNQVPRTYGVSGEHSVAIYYGPLFPKEKGTPITYPDYRYYVEVEGVTDHHFYIADDPSYLQLVPQLVDYMYKALQRSFQKWIREQKRLRGRYFYRYVPFFVQE